MTTQFFPVPPQGRGTSDIEAMDSYLLRLAREHGVSEYQFHSILAFWWNETKASHEHPLGRHIAYIQKVGHGGDIDTLIKAIERGTAQSGLASLTLSAFGDISGVHVGSFIKRVRCWCPACLRDQQRDGGVPYEKLLWRLQAVTRCHVHQIVLEDSCPACGGHQPRHVDTWPQCSVCNADLTAAEKTWRLAATPGSGEADMIQIVEYCAQHPSVIFQADAARQFWRLVRAEGSFFAPRSKESFHNRPVVQKTLIETLLRMAEEMQLPLLSILLDPVQAAAIRPLVMELPPGVSPPGRPRRHLSRSDIDRLGIQLRKALTVGAEPVSLKKVCEEFQSTTTAARYWFPELAQTLIAKNHNRIERQADQRDRALQALSLNADLVRRAELFGWHCVARELSEEFGIAVRRVRLRLAELKATERRSELGHPPPSSRRHAEERGKP